MIAKIKRMSLRNTFKRLSHFLKNEALLAVVNPLSEQSVKEDWVSGNSICQSEAMKLTAKNFQIHSKHCINFVRNYEIRIVL